MIRLFFLFLIREGRAYLFNSNKAWFSLAFFFLCILIFPLSFEGNEAFLINISIPSIWICVLFSNLISLENLFREDYENGTEEAEGKVTIQGVLSPFKRFGLNLVDQIYLDGWPKLVQQVDYETAKNDIGNSINESVIQLSAASAGAFEPIWKPVDLKPSRHFGYALQWFGLALVLICSYFYYGYKKD